MLPPLIERLQWLMVPNNPMHGILKFLRWCVRSGLPLAGLALHFVICLAYARRWDRVAALTVFPFWAWGILGFLSAFVSWLFFRSRFAGIMSLIWLATIFIGSDETRPLLRINTEKPLVGLPPDYQGKRLLRIITLNCKEMNPISAEEIIPWKPDIVLLQEAPYPQYLAALSNKLYPDGKPQEHFVGGYDCAVLTRGKITRWMSTVGRNNFPNVLRVLPCNIELDDRLMYVVCVHLQGAVTDVGLHRSSTWELHYRNRQSRRAEMIDVRKYLDALRFMPSNLVDGKIIPATPEMIDAPIVIGGDFNAPAGDAVFRELEPDFTNAFDAVGSGWGNTFPNKSPLLRIDHIYTNPQLTPIRARTVESVNSDHRMIVADFILAGE